MSNPSSPKLILAIADGARPRLVLCTPDGKPVPGQGTISFFQDSRSGDQELFVSLHSGTHKFRIDRDVIFDPDLIVEEAGSADRRDRENKHVDDGPHPEERSGHVPSASRRIDPDLIVEEASCGTRASGTTSAA